MSKFYQKGFAWFYDAIMASFEQKVSTDRFELIAPLKGTILDVGSGTGINFQYFNTDANIIAIEPSLPMLEKSKLKVGNKNIQLINRGVNDSELTKTIAPNSLDAIVSTLVLCTITEPEQAIENYKKWLKSNGKLIILEHIHSNKPINAKLQNMINPLWKIIGEGCNLNRHTDELLLEKGFQPLFSSYFNLGLRIHKGIYQKK